jgi:hypothetical protein
MFDAWQTLQEFAVAIRQEQTPHHRDVEAAKAIDILDNSDFMVPIEDEFICGDTSAGLPEPPCNLDKPCPVHDVRTVVAIVKLRPTLFQAQGADGRVWATATTYKLVEEHLGEQDTMFRIVTPEELKASEPDPCPIHPDEPDDAGCGEEADAARMMAGLRGIDLTGALAPEHNIEHDRSRLED